MSIQKIVFDPIAPNQKTPLPYFLAPSPTLSLTPSLMIHAALLQIDFQVTLTCFPFPINKLPFSIKNHIVKNNPADCKLIDTMLLSKVSLALYTGFKTKSKIPLESANLSESKVQFSNKHTLIQLSARTCPQFPPIHLINSCNFFKG